MAVVIIADVEQLERVIEGATFYYKRVPAPVRNRLLKECTNRRGIIDWGTYGIRVMERGLTGWKDVIDKTGKEVPFSVQIIPYLPDEVQGELLDLLGANIDKQESEQGNSEPTPSSNS